jgi:putative ABC transport system permease protein
MPVSVPDPIGVRLSLFVLRAVRFLVPSTVRADWMREWEAEIRHRWTSMDRRQETRWPDQAGLVRRSSGALADAAWLRQQFTADLDVMQDARFALRGLRKRPAISTLAVIVLALGIGGTVAVFSVVDTLLLRELPYSESHRIVTIWLTNIERPDERDGVAPGAFLDWRERSKVFTYLAAAAPFSFDYVGGTEPMTLIGALVTEGFFEALGVQPAMGRSFLPHEFTSGRSDVVLLGDGAWRRYFGGDPAVVGKTILLEGRPHLVAGVLPRWFHPGIRGGVRGEEIWAPKIVQDFERTIRGTRNWSVVGRLAPGVELAQARAELRTISKQLAQEYPRTLGTMTATVVPFRQHLAGPIREPLMVLFGAVVFVLLIACANVASLLLARGADRQREFTIRVAIGAGRWRLIRQLLVESLMMALLACVVGVGLAHAAIRVFVGLGPSVSQLNDLALDWRLIGFAIVLAGSTAVLFGLWPAIQLSRHAAGSGLQENTPNMTAGTSRRRLGGLLVVTEVALALVMLVSAGLLLRSFVSLLQVDPGFVKSNVLALQVFAYGDRYRNDEQRLAFFDRACDLIRSVPGVEIAGLVSAMPFISANINIEGGFRVEGRPEPPPNEQPTTHLTVATGEYFRAMRIPLRTGRVFEDSDDARAPPVAIINDLMAERLWPAESAVNQRVTVNWQGKSRTMQVVGVVGRLRHEALDRAPRSELFMPLAQAPFGSMTFVIRTSGEPGPLIPTLKARIWEIDPTLPFQETPTVDDLVSRSLAPRRSMTQLLGALAGLAFVLAAAGIYGVLTFFTARRTREIGVRIALGAGRSDILGMVIREGMSLVGAGVLVGVLATLVATRLLAALLYSISPTDPLTLAATTAGLAAVGLLACFVPAWRATKVDPLVAIRSE